MAVVPIDSETSHVVSVNLTDRGLDLPGGHTQVSDQGPLDTARRECAEEASIRIGTPVLVEVTDSDFYGASPEDLTYMLIYIHQPRCPARIGMGALDRWVSSWNARCRSSVAFSPT